MTTRVGLLLFPNLTQLERPDFCAAELLRGRRATSHWSARNLLAQFGAIPLSLPPDDARA